MNTLLILQQHCIWCQDYIPRDLLLSLEALCTGTKRFFYNLSIFESTEKSTFLKLKVGNVVRDYCFDTFSNRFTELRGPLVASSYTALSQLGKPWLQKSQVTHSTSSTASGSPGGRASHQPYRDDFSICPKLPLGQVLCGFNTMRSGEGQIRRLGLTGTHYYI